MRSSAFAAALRRALALAPAVAGAALAAPIGAAAQGAVALHIRPHVGDTIRMRFEENRETALKTKMKTRDTTITVTRRMLLLAHAVVTQSDESGAVVWNTTDSIAVAATRGGVQLQIAEPERRSLEGHRLQLHLSPEGSATVVEGANDMPAELQSLTSQMAATLPEKPVAVGQTWMQSMLIPVSDESGGTQGGANALVVRTTYRLDSLSHGGGIAFITLKGVITRDSTAADVRPGAKMTSSGTIDGWMHFDRRRGWWTEVEYTSIVRSTVHVATRPDPIFFQTKVTQRMRVTP